MTYGQVFAQVTDDWGRNVDALSHRAQRVVALAPHLVDLVERLDANILVAVDAHSVLTLRKTGIERIAAYPEPSVERILSLKPDLVLFWGAGLKRAVVDQLTKQGIRIYVSEPNSLGHILSSAARIASLISSNMPPPAWLQSYTKNLDNLPSQGDEKLSVFVQAWSEPLMTVGANTFIGDALQRCKVQTVLAPTNSTSALINPERVVASKPQVILATDSAATKAMWQARLRPELITWRYADLPTEWFSQPSISLIENLPKLCQLIRVFR